MLLRLIFVIVALTTTTAYCQSTKGYTSAEHELLKAFLGFKKELVNSMLQNKEVTDSAHVKMLLLDHLYGHVILDSSNRRGFRPGEVDSLKMQSIKSEISSFYNYYYERKHQQLAEHLAAMPSRLAKDKCVYNKLTPFQKANTFVFYDDRSPDNIIGFLLFIPDLPGRKGKPALWSWSLMYKYGRYIFRSVAGEEGVEYLF